MLGLELNACKKWPDGIIGHREGIYGVALTFATETLLPAYNSRNRGP